MMWRKVLSFLLAAGLILAILPAQAENQPLRAQEIEALAEQIRAMAANTPVLNDPGAEDAASEDGFAFQYEFGVVYADQPGWTGDTGMNAFLLMDAEVEGPRGITLNMDVNQVMEAIPCGNTDMDGTYTQAVLYLEGDPGNGFRYGRVERDGQRIIAMEYGETDPAAGRRISLNFGISGDGITSIRGEGLNETFSREQAEDLYRELEALTHVFAYSRVPRSLNGKELEEFYEGDLDFSVISYRTAEPRMLGENVEDVIMDNRDGTWLRRVDGEGFEAVFTCAQDGSRATLVSFTILSPELEGPRGVRLGDLFHEDFTRFRSGEGELSADGTKEVLYGEEGKAPYGVAEYGDGTEMALRYVTPTLGGPDVELLLRYQDTVLSEIILHSLEADD